ncbi:unnamed protein product [Rhizopus stolonifer]
MTIEFIPVCDWPLINGEPYIEHRLNERQTKRVLELWIKSVRQSLVSIERPKEMQLLFEQEKLDGVRLILKNGFREDFLTFGGNLQYVAPELFLSPRYHSECMDVWSLGITLYRLLVGRYPFNNKESDQALFEDMLQPHYSLPSTLSAEARGLIDVMIAPQETRIALNDILSHPWFQKAPKKKPVRLLKRIFKIVFKGPYPPP